MRKHLIRPYSARCIFIQRLRNTFQPSCPSLNVSVSVTPEVHSCVIALGPHSRSTGSCRAEEFLGRQLDCASLLRASLARPLLGPRHSVRTRKSVCPLL